MTATWRTHLAPRAFDLPNPAGVSCPLAFGTRLPCLIQFQFRVFAGELPYTLLTCFPAVYQNYACSREGTVSYALRNASARWSKKHSAVMASECDEQEARASPTLLKTTAIKYPRATPQSDRGCVCSRRGAGIDPILSLARLTILSWMGCLLKVKWTAGLATTC